MTTSTGDDHSKFEPTTALEYIQMMASDVEALTDSAHHLLGSMPYIPRSKPSKPGMRPDEGQQEDMRHCFRRLVVLLIAADSAAKKLLKEIEDTIERAYAAKRNKGDRGSSGSGGGTSGVARR
jgi:hypothetical protein